MGKSKNIIFLFMVVSLLCPSLSHAASLSLTPATVQTGIGQNVDLQLKVDSEGVSMNGVQATIRFPKNSLEVVSLNKTDSVLNFWLVDPTFSNTDGTITLAGGTPYGVSGSAVQILSVKFKTKSAGNAAISITEAAVTASDGSGTNILSKTKDAAISVLTTGVTPTTQPLPAPQQITRVAVPSEKLPIKPDVKVPLYPEIGKWYSAVSPYVASWTLPPDISGVSTSINKDPKSVPAGSSEGLFESKNFDALKNGVWYLHVRFRNNIGWGPTTHYKIAIDTDPPLAYTATISEGDKTGNPQPTAIFSTSDAVSGLKEYQLRVDNTDLTPIPADGFSGSYKLPLQSPGKKRLYIKAVDQAGNGVEDLLNFEILPITAPVISFTPTNFYPEDGQGLAVRGSTVLPDLKVLLKLQEVLSGGEGAVIASGTTQADDKGAFEFVFDRAIPNGRYVIVVVSQDERGAMSYPISSSEIRVRSKPIIQLGAIQLDSGGAAIFLLLVLVIGFGGGIWFYRRRQDKLSLRVEFAELEVTKMFKIIGDDANKLYQSFGEGSSDVNKEVAERLVDNIGKMEMYIKKGIEKINK